MREVRFGREGLRDAYQSYINRERRSKGKGLSVWIVEIYSPLVISELKDEEEKREGLLCSFVAENEKRRLGLIMGYGEWGRGNDRFFRNKCVQGNWVIWELSVRQIVTSQERKATSMTRPFQWAQTRGKQSFPKNTIFSPKLQTTPLLRLNSLKIARNFTATILLVKRIH